MLQDQCGDIVQLVVQHNNIRLQINGGQTLSSIEVSRHFETVPRLSSSLTRKRRNLPPLPPTSSSTFPKQPKRQLYETVETLEVPNVKELKPILINRGRLLGKKEFLPTECIFSLLEFFNGENERVCTAKIDKTNCFFPLLTKVTKTEKNEISMVNLIYSCGYPHSKEKEEYRLDVNIFVFSCYRKE